MIDSAKPFYKRHRALYIAPDRRVKGSIVNKHFWMNKVRVHKPPRLNECERIDTVEAYSRSLLIHFRVGLRFFVGDALAPTDELSPGEDSFLPWPLSSLVGLLASALVVSVAILPPSFSQRSSIFFFRRFLAIGSGIGVYSLLFHSFQINASREIGFDIST